MGINGETFLVKSAPRKNWERTRLKFAFLKFHLGALLSKTARRHLRGRTALQANLSLPPAIPGRCPRLLTV